MLPTAAPASPTVSIPSGPTGSVASAESRARFPLLEVPRANYETLAEQGRGGIGVVRRARDRRLDREVAIKELQRDSHEARLRFEREMRITAVLQHPGVVPVHEAGLWPDGSPFYAMRLVEGSSLKELVAGTRRLDERLALLPHVLVVAETIAYTHSRRIIHRDLKPSNIVVGPYGETVVIDWGEAKDLDEPCNSAALDGRLYDTVPGEGLTAAGQVVGTPAYMPPEQAQGLDVDERADVYALGAILYHVLAGTPPYAAGHSDEVLANVLAGPPAPLTSIEPGVPRDLSTIVSKAMSRRPADRYASARELVEDLRRFRTGQLVTAHHYSRRALFLRWVRQYRTAVMISALALALLTIVGATSLRRIVRERQRADAERSQAERERAAAERARTESDARANALVLTHARNSLDHDPTASLAWLKQYPAYAADWDGARTIAMDAVSRGVARHVLRGHDGIVHVVAFSPDGARIATGGDDKILRVWDRATGQLLASMPLRGEIFAIAVAPDGSALAAGGGGDEVAVLSWRLDLLKQLRVSNQRIPDLTFSPDGRWLAAANGSDNTVRLWEVSSGEGTTLRGHDAYVHVVAFSPDSRQLASAGGDGKVLLWDAATKKARQLGRRDVEVTDIKFSPDGDRLASADARGVLTMWSTRSDTRPVRLRDDHPTGIRDIAFSPSGRWLAAARQDGGVRAWNLATHEVRSLRHDGDVYVVRFQGDDRLISSGLAGTVRIWELGSPNSWVLRGHRSAVYSIAISPDGRWIASGDQDGTVRVTGMPEAKTRVVAEHRDDIYHLSFSGDGRYVATDSRDRNVGLVDLATGQRWYLSGHNNLIYALVFFPDNRHFATAGWDSTIRVWNAADRSSRVLRGHAGYVWTLAVSPDGRWLVSGDSKGTVFVWDLQTGLPVSLTAHQGDVRALAFSPKGAFLASAGSDGTLRIWEMATRQSQVIGRHADVVNRIAFLDESTLVSASSDRTLRVWRPGGGLERVLSGHPGRVRALAVSPAGELVASGSDDGAIHLWNLEANTSWTLAGHEDDVRALAFSPDGKKLISGSEDGTVRLWSVSAHNLLAVLREHNSFVMDVDFAPDGRTCASAGIDKTLRLWPCASSPDVPTDAGELREFFYRLTADKIQDGRPSAAN